MRALAATLAALLLLCVPSAASAQDLTWRWHEQELVSYRIQTYMQFRPGELRLYAGKNIDARVEDLALGIETDCKSVVLTRRSQELECRIRKAEMGLGATPSDQANADKIAVEYAELLAVSTVQLQLSREGRIKTVDLEGIPKDTEREGARHEMLRMVVARAFGALELELPKDGDTRGEPWVQGGLPLTMRLPVVSGTVGKAKVHHTVESAVDDVVTIQTQGQASAQSGQELELAKAGHGSARVVQTIWTGTSKFNTKTGVLLSNEYRVSGNLTAGGNAAGSDFYLTQVGMAEHIEDWDAEAAAMQAARDAEAAAAAAAAAPPPAEAMAADEAAAVEQAGVPAEPAPAN